MGIFVENLNEIEKCTAEGESIGSTIRVTTRRVPETRCYLIIERFEISPRHDNPWRAGCVSVDVVARSPGAGDCKSDKRCRRVLIMDRKVSTFTVFRQSMSMSSVSSALRREMLTDRFCRNTLAFARNDRYCFEDNRKLISIFNRVHCRPLR